MFSIRVYRRPRSVATKELVSGASSIQIVLIQRISMNQEEYWRTKWDNREDESINNFAKGCFSLIKKRNLRTLLDLGCGDGRDTTYFSKHGLKVTALDFSEGGINKLNNKIQQENIKNITPFRCDIKKLRFEEKSFDVIYAHLSLHYFDDKTTTQIFNKLYEILKPNGLIFIKCKSTDDPLFGKGNKVGENMYIKGHLRHFFDKNYMADKLKKFKIIEIRKTSSTYHQYKSSFIEAIATK